MSSGNLNRIEHNFFREEELLSLQQLSSHIRRYPQVLEVSGIGTSIFSAHSVRGASSLAAASVGISISNIFKAAGWSPESTFHQFYYRSRVVLSQLTLCEENEVKYINGDWLQLSKAEVGGSIVGFVLSEG